MSILSLYEAKRAAGDIVADPAQTAAVAALDRLCTDFTKKTGFWQKAEVPRGVYLYGPVGRGKTLLMDLFYESVPLKARRRVHFHAFMQEIHGRLHVVQDIPYVAKDIARTTKLLCLDEFQVTNVADAMIMARLFSALFKAGVVLVATSNTEPDHLYDGGLQRSLFLPFISILKGACESVAVMGAADYRRRRLQGVPSYFCPPDVAALDNAFVQLTDGVVAETETLDVSGKSVKITRAAHGVACLAMSDFETQTLWLPEFQALADSWPTLLLSGVEAIPPDANDRAERFICFVDVWYDRQCKLMISANVMPEWIYSAGTLVKKFERTVSRLYEMQSEEWWDRPVRARDDAG